MYQYDWMWEIPWGYLGKVVTSLRGEARYGTCKRIRIDQESKAYLGSSSLSSCRMMNQETEEILHRGWHATTHQVPRVWSQLHSRMVVSGINHHDHLIMKATTASSVFVFQNVQVNYSILMRNIQHIYTKLFDRLLWCTNIFIIVPSFNFFKSSSHRIIQDARRASQRWYSRWYFACGASCNDLL